jgi:phosphoribosylamine--glycine ligase/phosphoribosylformylglycinamidine cyclo-ligase
MEGSKAFSKDFMSKYHIPTARYANFSDFESAKRHLQSIDYKVVIKASGLAAGKGVLIPENQKEALDALESIMVKKEFGSSGDEVVIEEYLEGQEISVLALSDGYTVVLLPGAQDHKRIGEGDTGPNTGGMGAYAPTPVASSDHMKASLKSIIQQTINGMRKEGVFESVLLSHVSFTKAHPHASHSVQACPLSVACLPDSCSLSKVPKFWNTTSGSEIQKPRP